MKCVVKNKILYLIESNDVPADVDCIIDIGSIYYLKTNIEQLITKYQLKRVVIPFSSNYLHYQNILINTDNRSMSRVRTSVLSTNIPQQFSARIMSIVDNQSENTDMKNVLLVLDRPLNQHFEAYLFYLYYEKDINIIISSNGEINTEIEYDLVVHFGHATSEGLLINNRKINVRNLKSKVLYSLGCYSADFFLLIAQSSNIDCFIGYTSNAFGQIPVNGSGRLFLYTMENCLSRGFDLVESVNKAIRRLCNDIGINDELNKKIIFYNEQQQVLSINTMLNYIVVGNAKFRKKSNILSHTIEGVSCGKQYLICKNSVILIFSSTYVPEEMEIHVTNQQGNQWRHKLNEVNIYETYTYKKVLSAYYRTHTGYRYYIIINEFYNGNFCLNQDVDSIYFYENKSK